MTKEKSEISLGTWNINGILNKILGDKTKNKDFLEAISKTLCSSLKHGVTLI